MVRGVMLVLLLTVGVLGGCASNPWREGFAANPAAVDAGLIDPSAIPLTSADSAAPAEVRTIGAERFAAYVAGARDERVMQDVADDRLPRETRADRMRRFLEALRVEEPAERVEVIGVSRFTNTSFAGGPRGSLAAFARAVGAEYAVAVTEPLGLRETVIREPVTTEFTGRAFRKSESDRRGDREETLIVSGSETTYLPLVVERATYRHTAFFLRVVPPGLSEALPSLGLPPPPDAHIAWSR